MVLWDFSYQSTEYITELSAFGSHLISVRLTRYIKNAPKSHDFYPLLLTDHRYESLRDFTGTAGRVITGQKWPHLLERKSETGTFLFSLRMGRGRECYYYFTATRKMNMQ